MINTNSLTQQTAPICRMERTVLKDKNRAPETLDDLVSEESRLFFHKLCLHQTELERQNEKLLLAKKELANERTRYLDLYDNAPVGYCTISEKGVILEANLTAATMLGVPRELLVQQPLSQFILDEDQGLIHFQLEDNHRISDIKVCELRMKRRDETVFWVHLSATAAQNSVGTKECRLVISNITHKKFGEEVSNPKVELNGRGKILVMDDDNMVLNTLGTMLETLGYTVELTSEGQQAVDKYAESQQSGAPFDAVVMDLINPGGMGGREAVHRLLAVDPRAKVIVASGYSNNSVNSDFKNYGFSGVIAKPYRASELSKLIEQVLHD